MSPGYVRDKRTRCITSWTMGASRLPLDDLSGVGEESAASAATKIHVTGRLPFADAD
jgi:hypothetical protein